MYEVLSCFFKMLRVGCHNQFFWIVIFGSFMMTKADPCCQQLVINGTLNSDPWYQNMMGIFTLFEELPWISYEKQGDISGKYPVYVHYFEDFVSHPERRSPPRVFLYFYLNEIEGYPEAECVERGCWIISMYDATPGNYWFGKKWYYIKTKPTPKCPDHLTADESRFVNQDGDVDPGLTITCLTTSGL